MPEFMADLLSGVLVTQSLAGTKLNFTKATRCWCFPSRQCPYRICAYRCRNPCILLSPSALH